MNDTDLKIVIADDHNLVRDGISQLVTSLGYAVSHQCKNGKEVLDYCCQHPTDIVLMDINMPIMDGIEATGALRDACPDTKVIAMSMLDDDLSLIRMMKAGAKSYVLKESPPEELDKAIRGVAAKGYYYSDFLSGRLINSLGSPDENDLENILGSISDRELEFLKHSCTGMTYKEIADKMCVSPRSIDGYRDALFEKLEVRSRVELAIFAIKHHIVRI